MDSATTSDQGASQAENVALRPLTLLQEAIERLKVAQIAKTTTEEAIVSLQSRHQEATQAVKREEASVADLMRAVSALFQSASACNLQPKPKEGDEEPNPDEPNPDDEEPNPETKEEPRPAPHSRRRGGGTHLRKGLSRRDELLLAFLKLKDPVRPVALVDATIMEGESRKNHYYSTYSKITDLVTCAFVRKQTDGCFTLTDKGLVEANQVEALRKK
jgi:hypothetical protein